MQNKIEDNFFRPISEDRIQYFFIGERPEFIGFEIPSLFQSQWFNSIKIMPKSIIQIIDPYAWHLAMMKNHISSHLAFSILFDDYPEDKYDFLFQIPCKALVIFLNSQNEEIFKKLESLNRFFLISSDNEEVYSKIKLSQALQSKVFDDLESFFDKILNFTLGELSLTLEQFTDLQHRNFEEIEKKFQALNIKKTPNFAPATANVSNIYQLLSLDIPRFLELQHIELEERVKVLLETSLSLGMLSLQLKFHYKEKLPNILSLPTIILAYPFFNPDYRELFKLNVDKTEGNNRFIAKQMKYLRFIEQDTSTYTYEAKLEPKDRINPELVLAVKQRHTLFLDFVGYLHSTFEISPYIRVPARGASLNTYINRLSPSQYKKAQNRSSLSKNIAQIGEALSANLPTEVVKFLGQYADGIFAISDLPIEWTTIQDTPLAFLCDTCRIPETGPTSILSQFNVNCDEFFQIPKNILNKTLVVCGATLEDSIFKNYQTQVSIQNKESLPYKTAHVQSKSEFFDVVNRIRPHLLIIDSHGDFKTQSEGSYIWMGNEKVLGRDVIEYLPQIPLVILSCCWGTPIYGNSNTIAQAFFERGTFSVLSTLLPISIDRGFILYYRILNNLLFAAEHGIHENWMNFVSHSIRTSYFDDLLSLIISKFGLDILESEKYESNRLEWAIKCMHREARPIAYKEVKEVILGCIKDSCKSKAERFLKTNEPIPEFLLYTHLGRGDLIKFDSWIEAN